MTKLDQASPASPTTQPIWRVPVASVLSASVALMLIGLLVVWNAFHFVAEDMRDKTADELLATVTLRGEQIENYLSERRGDGIILTNRASIGELLDPETAPELRDEARATSRTTLAQFIEQYHYRQITLFDGNLNAVLGQNADLDTEAMRIALSRAMEQRQEVFVDLHKVAGDVLAFGIAAPVTSRGHVVGVAYMDINAADIPHGLFNKWPGAYSTMALRLLVLSGDVVHEMWADDTQKSGYHIIDRPLNDPHNLAARLMREGRGGVVSGIGLQNQPQIGAARKIAGTTWTVLARVDIAEVEKPLRGLSLRMSGVALMMFGTFMCLALLLLSRRQRDNEIKQSRLAARYRNAIHVLPDGFLRLDHEGVIVDVNDATAALTGYPSDELIDRSMSSLEVIRAARNDGLSDDDLLAPGFERLSWQRKDGSLIDIAASKSPANDVGETYVVVRDISQIIAERQRLLHEVNLHRLLNNVHQAIQRLGETKEILAEICRDLAVDSHIVLIWAGWIDEDADRVIPIAANGRAIGYVEGLVISIDPKNPTARGPCGTAAREQRIVVDDNIANSALMEPWRNRAAQFGLRGALSLPLIVGGKTVAVLVLYSDEASYFDPDTTKLIGEMGETISVALDAAENRQAARRLADAQAASEARLQGIMLGTPMPMLVFDLHTFKASFVNTAFVQMFGDITTHQISLSDWFDEVVIDPVDRETLRWTAAQLSNARAAGGSTVPMPEVRLRDVQGKTHFIQQSLSIVGDEVLMALIDLTELREQQQQILQQEAIYTAVAEHAAESIVLVDPETMRFIQFNAATHNMLGYTAEEFAALPPYGFVDPPMIPHSRMQIQRAVQEGTAQYESRHICRDGTLREVLMSVQMITFQGRSLLACVWTDVTEREQRTRQIAGENEKHRVLFEQSSDGIIIVSQSGELLDVNPRMEILARSTRAAAIGTKAWQWSIRFHNEPQWRKALSDGVLAKPVETMFRRADGTLMDAEVIWSAANLLDGLVYFAVVRDITNRRRDERELERYRHQLEDIVRGRTKELRDANEQLVEAKDAAEAANRAKSSFLAVMSHEIRTPLNGVIGMSEILARAELPPDQADSVRTIRDSAVSLMSVIDDILDFSKIEADRIDLEETAVQIDDLLESTCNGLAQLATARRLSLSVYVAPDVPQRLMADPTRLRQVCLNLLSNAVKFGAPASGQTATVEVRVVLDTEGAYRISVTDHGIGMAPEVMRNLFTPFSQAEASTTRRFGGTGLGLAIVKRLTELKRGRVEVESAPGQGACFTIILPLKAASSAPVHRLDGVACTVEGQLANAATQAVAAQLVHVGARVETTDLPGAANIRVAVADTGRVVDFHHNAQRWHATLDSDGRFFDLGWLRRDRVTQAVAIAAGLMTQDGLNSGADLIVQDRLPPKTIDAARAARELVLVAEDDAINRKVIIQQLTLLGYAAETAENGRIAFEAWQHGGYGLVLTDLFMPEMDGSQLAQAIRNAEGDGQHVPIIVLSANALRGEAERAREFGVDLYLNKPVLLGELQAALERFLPLANLPAPPIVHAPAAPPKAFAVFDQAALTATVGDDLEMQADILADYIPSAADLVQRIQAAISQGDMVEAASMAHRLKSSSRSVGALALGERSAHIELAARSGNRDGLSAEAADLDVTLAQTKAHIETHLTSPTANDLGNLHDHPDR